MLSFIILSLKKHHKMKHTGIQCSNSLDVDKSDETYCIVFYADNSQSSGIFL